MKNMCFKRFFAAFLSFIILTAQCAVPLTALAEGVRDDRMHFVVRQWHAVAFSEDGDVVDDSSVNNSTLIEGYIQPGTDGQYIVTNLEGDLLTSIDAYKPYIEEKNIDRENGILKVKVAPRDLDGVPLEIYAGTSISAGHSRISPPDVNDPDNADLITIEYDPYVHLTKCHVFYVKNKDTKPGSLSEFGKGGVYDTDGIYSDDGVAKKDLLEYDTAELYVYNEDQPNAGEVVYTTLDPNVTPDPDNPDAPTPTVHPIKPTSTYWPEGSSENNSVAHAVKVYSTDVGLHTDKTAKAWSEDRDPSGRTFDITLESWYGGLTPANVGMIIDASGSMAWTADSQHLKPIQLSADKIKELGIEDKILSANNKPKSETDWSNIFLNNAQLDKILDPHNTANSPLGVSGYSYFVYDAASTVKEYAPLGYWDGIPTPAPPEIDADMIGLYKFDKGSLSNLASATGGTATLIDQQSASGSFTFDVSSSTGKSTIDTSKGNLVINGSNTAGIRLDAVPSGNEFTISFKINKDSSGDAANASSGISQYPVDVLYVGALAPAGTDYLRVIREARYVNWNNGPFGSVQRSWLTGYQGTPKNNTFTANGKDIPANRIDPATNTVSAVSAFHNAEVHYVTYVFDGENITSYFAKADGTVLALNITDNAGDIAKTKGLTLPESGNNIIFNGFKNSYNGAPIYIDDIQVYDKAFDENEVKQRILGIDPDSESEEPDPITFKFEVSSISGDRDFGNGLKYIYGNGATKIFNKSSLKGKFDDGFAPGTYGIGFDSKSIFPDEATSGSPTSRVFEFTPPCAGTIKIYFANMNADDVRYCVVKQNNEIILNAPSLSTRYYQTIAETPVVDANVPVYIGTNNKIAVFGIVFTPYIEPVKPAEYRFDNPDVTSGDIQEDGTIGENSVIKFGDAVTYYAGAKDAYKNGRTDDYNDGTDPWSSMIKIGGSTNSWNDPLKRVIEFKPPSSGTLRVYFWGTGSTDRTCVIKQRGITRKCENSVSSGEKTVAECKVSKDTVYIGCEGGGVYISGFSFTPGEGPGADPEATPFPEYTRITQSSSRTIGFTLGNFLNNNVINNTDTRGWYYVTHQGGSMNKHYFASDVQTAKQLVGLSVNTDYKTRFVDKITLPDSTIMDKDTLGSDDGNPSAKDDKGVSVTGNGTGYEYNVAKNTATQFYVDENGYLRCFFARSGVSNNGNEASNTNINSGASNYQTSYVYEYADDGYVKVEALQRAAASFTTKLGDLSPSSKVSAVRFSSDNVDSGGDPRLVMLDWTTDTKESAGMFSLKRGDRKDIVNSNGKREGGMDGTIKGTNSVTGDVVAWNKWDSDSGEGLLQYNYGLTGSTYTAKGFEAYDKYLRGQTENDTAKKYLIVFTDGKDSAWDSYKSNPSGHPAIKAARDLRKNGEAYTIFAIMLSGGSVVPGSATGEYEDARMFLEYLSGERDLGTGKLLGFDDNNKWIGTTPADDDGKWEVAYKDGTKIRIDKEYDENGNVITPTLDKNNHLTGSLKRVFTTYEELEAAQEGKTDEEKKKINASDVLVDIFSTEVIKYITKELKGYSVQDYIDPRFDLVDESGNQWHLNPNGIVKIGDKEYNLVNTPENELVEGDTFGVKRDKDNDGYDDGKFYINLTLGDKKARLYYDNSLDDTGKTKDMYYLKWRSETIPTNASNAKYVQVWESTITVRAKDDFIGGNAVLTNGNAGYQNYVFSPDDKRSGGKTSSGTSDSSADVDYPSKGFPRTTVNVKANDTEVKYDLPFYKGENLDYEIFIDKIIEANSGNSSVYYWEYLKRYARYMAATDHNAGRDYKGWLAYLCTEIMENSEFYTEEDEEVIAGTAKAGTMKNGYSIPYYYLPGDPNNPVSQAGGELHWGDSLGDMYYALTLNDAYFNDTYVKSTDSTEANLSAKYVPKSIEDRERKDTSEGGDGLSDNERLVQKDKNYLFDGRYKPEEGDEMTDSPEIPGKNETAAVSGEIILHMAITGDEASDIQNLINKNKVSPDLPISYAASLNRTYNGVTQYVGRFTISGKIGDLLNDGYMSAKVAIDPAFNGYFDDNIQPPESTGSGGTAGIRKMLFAALSGDDDNGNGDGTDDGDEESKGGDGLPLGRYSLVADSNNSIDSKWIKFGDIGYYDFNDPAYNLTEGAEGETEDEKNAREKESYDNLFNEEGLKGHKGSASANPGLFDVDQESNELAANETVLGGVRDGISEVDDDYLTRMFALFYVPLEVIPFGSVEVVKEVLADQKGVINTTKEFAFTIELTSDTAIDTGEFDITNSGNSNITWHPATGKNVKGEFKLTHGDRVNIDFIPVGVSYSVSEGGLSDGYYLKDLQTTNGEVFKRSANDYYGASDIEKSKTHLYVFENAPIIDLPNTGGRGFRLLPFIIGAFILFAAGYIYSRKKKHAE